jgi:hypothetical protein
MTDFLEKKRHAASEDFGTNKGGYARCSYMLRGYRHRGVTAIYIGFSQRAFEEWRDSGKTALLLRSYYSSTTYRRPTSCSATRRRPTSSSAT